MYGSCKTAGSQQSARASYYGRPYYRRPKYNVPTNIVEFEDRFEVHIYALSFEKEQVKVSVAGDVLYITGTRSFDETNKPNFVRQEYPVKSFERTFELSDRVDVGGIKARHENGVVIVVVPKKAPAEPTQQEITVE